MTLKKTQTHRVRVFLKQTGTSSSSENDAVNFREMLKMPTTYWLITLCCVTVYISAFPFFQVTSTDFLTENFNFSTNDANLITSLPNLVSAFTSPVLGLLVDKCGRRPYFLILSTLMFISCYAVFMGVEDPGKENMNGGGQPDPNQGPVGGAWAILGATNPKTLTPFLCLNPVSRISIFILPCPART